MKKPGFLLALLMSGFYHYCLAQPSGTGAFDTLKTVTGNTEEWHVTYPDSSLKEIIRLKDHKKHGLQESFFRKGVPEKRISYTDGFLDGEHILYDNQGRIREKKSYRYDKVENNSVLNGEFVSYINGQVSIRTFYSDSLKDGKYEEYYPGGKLRTKATYKKGLLTGAYESYSGNGQLMEKTSYGIFKTNGKDTSACNGYYTYYNYHGFKGMEGNYKNGKKNAVWKEYFQSGILRAVNTYKDDRKHGPQTVYFENGNIERRFNYYEWFIHDKDTLKNMYDGRSEEYFNNGKIKKLESYKTGLRHGPWETYFESGILSGRHYFNNNLQTGKSETWDDKGYKTHEVNYILVKTDSNTVSLKQGMERGWTNNILSYEMFYENGKAQGIRRGYYNTGELSSENNYKDGLMHGRSVEYHRNGKIKSERNHHSYYDQSKAPKTMTTGWVNEFDEEGRPAQKYFSDSAGNNLFRFTYYNGIPVQYQWNKLMSVNFFPDGKVMSFFVPDPYYKVMFAQYFYRNGNLRKLIFQDLLTLSSNEASFTYDGTLLQLKKGQNEKKDGPQPSKKTLDDILKITGMHIVSNRLYSDSLIDGTYEINFADGNVFARLSFQKNIPHGPQLFLDPFTRDTLYFIQFVNGMPAGYYVQKFGGKTVTEAGMIPGANSAGWKVTYRMDGIPSRKEVYSVDKKEVYEETGYHDNGKVRSVTNHISNVGIYYDAQGLVMSQSAIIDDSLGIKEFKYYFPGTSQLKSHYFHKNNLQDSTSESYFLSGQLEQRTYYKAGKQQGLYEKFDVNGKLLYTGHYINGKQEGTWYDMRSGKPDTLYFVNDKLQLKPSLTLCACVDTSYNSNKTRYAGSLSSLLEFRKLKKYLSPFVHEVDSFNYDANFFTYHQASGNGYSGFTAFKLLMYKEVAFTIPADQQIKVIINPCRNKGYVSNADITVSYSEDESDLSVGISPGRIGLQFLKSPLRSAVKDHKDFTFFVNVSAIRYYYTGSLVFETDKDPSYCFIPGIIKNFLKMEIKDADMFMFKNPAEDFARNNASRVKLTDEELNNFFGLMIKRSEHRFPLKTSAGIVEAEAKSHMILAGGKYVSGTIMLPCAPVSADEFETTVNDRALRFTLQDLKSDWLKNGFTRLDIKYIEGEKTIAINFFAE